MTRGPFRLPRGGLIDRTRAVKFTFDGRRLSGFVLLDHFGARELGGKVWAAGGGAVGSLWLLVSLERTAHAVGVVWLLAGLAYAAWRTRAFRVPLPSAIAGS